MTWVVTFKNGDVREVNGKNERWVRSIWGPFVAKSIVSVVRKGAARRIHDTRFSTYYGSTAEHEDSLRS